MTKLLVALALATLALTASAKGVLECYEEPGTLKVTCIDVADVRSNADTRAAPIFQGGSNGVRPTGYTFVANCAKSIATLQDRDGVNFGGGPSYATPSSGALYGAICRVAKTRKDAKLRQF